MSTNLEQFRKAQNVDLAQRVKEIRAIHPSWSYDRAFTFALEQNPELSQVTVRGFAKTQCSPSRLAQAESQAPAGQNDFTEQGGWQASRKRLVAELSNAAASALTAGDRERIQSWIARLSAASSQIDYERELTNPQGVLATARYAATSQDYDDPWYH